MIFIPIFGLSYLFVLRNEILQTEDKLLSFINQGKIINAMPTDVILSKLYKIEKFIQRHIERNIIITLVLIITFIILVHRAAINAKSKSQSPFSNPFSNLKL